MPIKIVECKDWTVPGQAGKLLMYVEHRGAEEAPARRRYSALLWVENEDASKRAPVEAR